MYTCQIQDNFCGYNGVGIYDLFCSFWAKQCASCGQYCIEFSLYLLYMAFSFKIASLYGLMGQGLVNSSCTIDSITDSQKGGKQ